MKVQLFDQLTCCLPKSFINPFLVRIGYICLGSSQTIEHVESEFKSSLDTCFSNSLLEGTYYGTDRTSCHTRERLNNRKRFNWRNYLSRSDLARDKKKSLVQIRVRSVIPMSLLHAHISYLINPNLSEHSYIFKQINDLKNKSLFWIPS